MTTSRVLIFAAILALLFGAIAAWLLNVPILVIGAGAVVSLIAGFLWLSRNAVAGKRSGDRSKEVESKQA